MEMTKKRISEAGNKTIEVPQSEQQRNGLKKQVIKTLKSIEVRKTVVVDRD